MRERKDESAYRLLETGMSSTFAYSAAWLLAASHTAASYTPKKEEEREEPLSEHDLEARIGDWAALAANAAEAEYLHTIGLVDGFHHEVLLLAEEQMMPVEPLHLGLVLPRR